MEFDASAHAVRQPEKSQRSTTTDGEEATWGYKLYKGLRGDSFGRQFKRECAKLGTEQFLAFWTLLIICFIIDSNFSYGFYYNNKKNGGQLLKLQYGAAFLWMIASAYIGYVLFLWGRFIRFPTTFLIVVRFYSFLSLLAWGIALYATIVLFNTFVGKDVGQNGYTAAMRNTFVVTAMLLLVMLLSTVMHLLNISYYVKETAEGNQEVEEPEDSEPPEDARLPGQIILEAFAAVFGGILFVWEETSRFCRKMYWRATRDDDEEEEEDEAHANREHRRVAAGLEGDAAAARFTDSDRPWRNRPGAQGAAAGGDEDTEHDSSSEDNVEAGTRGRKKKAKGPGGAANKYAVARMEDEHEADLSNAGDHERGHHAPVAPVPTAPPQPEPESQLSASEAALSLDRFNLLWVSLPKAGHFECELREPAVTRELTDHLARQRFHVVSVVTIRMKEVEIGFCNVRKHADTPWFLAKFSFREKHFAAEMRCSDKRFATDSVRSFQLVRVLSISSS